MKSILLSLTAALSLTAQAQTATNACYEYGKPWDQQRFEQWRNGVQAEALKPGSGISAATWAKSVPYMQFNPEIQARDKGQNKIFTGSFVDYAVKHADDKLAPARAQLNGRKRQGLEFLEQKYGVSRYLLVAFWGMESNFAENLIPENKPGQFKIYFPVLESMTTMAFDCRRSEFFRKNLLDALRLIERGDVEPATYKGQWAGEVSGLQFTPTLLYRNGVSYMPNQIPDPINKVEDMFATAANVFVSYGWQRGQPITQEVLLPDNLPWEKYAEADAPLKYIVKDSAGLEREKFLHRTHPLSYWKNLGIRARTGSLPDEDLETALILPLGWLGPAILAYPNFNAVMEWNNSLNNALTASYFASRLEVLETPVISSGRAKVEVLKQAEMMEVQTYLKSLFKQGRIKTDVGNIDGSIGSGVREAVREVQLQIRDRNIPPDGYPSTLFLNYVRSQQRFSAN